MTVNVRGVSMAPEFTAQDTAAIASCRTDVEMPDVSPTAGVISARALADAAEARGEPAVAGPDIAAGAIPMRHTKPMSMLTARLFNLFCPRNVGSLNTHIRGWGIRSQAQHFHFFNFSRFFQFST